MKQQIINDVIGGIDIRYNDKRVNFYGGDNSLFIVDDGSIIFLSDAQLNDVFCIEY